MVLEPLNERVMVAREDSATESPGTHGVKIALPEQVQKQSQRCYVMATWEPYTNDRGVERRSRVKEGDIVWIPKYGGEEFELNNGQKVVFIKESDLHGKMRDYSVVSDEGERKTG
jgi:co-chaperonin GroES (HSP10)